MRISPNVLSSTKMKRPPAPPPDAVKLCEFITASPTPFQAVSNLTARLASSGFTHIRERSFLSASSSSNASAPQLKPGGSYFYTRNQSSLVAFTLPSRPSPSTSISFAVGHLDSPVLKVRPVSKREKEGYIQVGVELYGGGIWPTWFDRDLSLAGRVIVSQQAQDEGGSNSKYTSKLVKIDRPLMRIPNLAIHLERTLGDNLKFNKETELRPVLGLVERQLNAPVDASEDGDSEGKERGEQEKVEDVADMSQRHHPMLLELLADELGCGVSDIQDFELSLYDTQPSCVGGLSNEFVFSPRLDNLVTSYSSIEGLIRSATAPNASSDDPTIRCVILFDNEEVGSVSHHGAESNLLPSFVERVCAIDEFRESGLGYHQLLANSFLISADMGHAINPNYAGRYEPNHAPKLNGGIVIKTNANQRYTSNAQTTFLLRRVAKRAGVPVQEFEIRNDSTCGSTVGPHLSTHVRTVDIGLAQLSMHSIRETMGSADVAHYIKFFQTYFEGFAEYDRELTID